MKQMKKLLAFVLAFAMIITIYQPSVAYAATKKPRLNAKTMTLQVGQKKTLKVKNAGKKAKLKWSSNKKSIATVSKKGVVKAVKAGNAVVTCKVTTKNGKTTKLTCKVAVKKTAKVTSLTVGSQKELEKALKNKNVRKITVATQGAVTFTVPQGDYSKVELVINAPNADVVNNGKFKSIDIQAIKPNTYRENAKGNVITVSATGDARVIVETGATVAKIMVSGSKGNVKLVVDGTLSGITIDAPVNVTVEGKTTVAVPVTVNEKAAGANVTSSMRHLRRRQAHEPVRPHLLLYDPRRHHEIHPRHPGGRRHPRDGQGAPPLLPHPRRGRQVLRHGQPPQHHRPAQAPHHPGGPQRGHSGRGGLRPG